MGAQIGNSDLLMVALAKDGYDPGLIAEVTASVAAHPLSGVGIGIFIIGHILGMVLLGLALVRAGLVPTWAGAALAVSQPFHLVSAVLLPSRLLDLTLGWGLTVIAFAMVSRTLLRMSDEEFDTAAGAREPARPIHGPWFAAPSV
jgi:hypothetical protein